MELSTMGGRRLTSQHHLIQQPSPQPQLDSPHMMSHHQPHLQQQQLIHQQSPQSQQQLQQQQPHYHLLQQQQQHHTSYPLHYHPQQTCIPMNMTTGHHSLRIQRHRKHSAANKYHLQNPPSSPGSSTDEYQSRQSRYPEDPDMIEVYLEDEPLKHKEALSLSRSKQGKWQKSNIVATMERYDPSTCGGISSQTLPHSYYCHGSENPNNPEYAYAYCEPHLLKQHQFIHSISPAVHNQKMPASLSSNALSKPPSTNSLRALLTKSFRKSSIGGGGGRDASGGIIGAGSERHTFTTRYGTKENIYEDVGVGGNSSSVTRTKLGVTSANVSTHQSTDSINKINIEEEFRIVRNQHDRIMGELNLSVEALLMPTQDETELILLRERELNIAEGTNPDDTYEEATNDRLSPMQTHQHPNGGNSSCNSGGDMDSGISGSSSSGASYSGSVRYHRTTYLQPPPPSSSCSSTKTLTTNECDTQKVLTNNVGLCNSLGTSDATILMNSSKLSCCFYGSDPYKSHPLICQPQFSCGQNHSTQPTTTQIESISEKVNFWNRLGKLKLSGVFNSSQQQQQHHQQQQQHQHIISQKQSQCDSNHPLDDDQAKWWKLPVCKSNRIQTPSMTTTPRR